MEVEILRHPIDEDWERCKMLALNTIGRKYTGKTAVSEDWKRRILRAEHSPIRTLMFTILLKDVPYWVAMHFRTHKYGVEHYISTQRNDRQDEYDRNGARQDAPVDHILDVDAQELMYMARKRLCGKAAEETIEVMEIIKEKVLAVNPEFKGLLVPQCVYCGGVCHEMKPCGKNQRLKNAASKKEQLC